MSTAVSHYGIPPNVSLPEALHQIFIKFSNLSTKESLSDADHHNDTAAATTLVRSAEVTMDHAAFTKFCQKCPNLSTLLTRSELDLIYSKCLKTSALPNRRIGFSSFLEGLLHIAERIYPDSDPTLAMGNLLSRFVLVLAEGNDVDKPSVMGEHVIELIVQELCLSDEEVEEYEKSRSVTAQNVLPK